MEGINPEEITEKYNMLPEIWPASDRWHSVTHKMIERFIKKYLRNYDFTTLKILNAGSAGNNYGLPDWNTTHVDLAGNTLKKCINSIVASIEQIPVEDKSFDIILCVGSVINYCDPLNVIKEFKRIIKKNGIVILEFENSYTLELLGKKTFNKPAVFIRTFYNHQEEKIWYFSEKYVRELFAEFGFKIIKRDVCHILSPMIYRWTKNENRSAPFAVFDNWLKHIPGIKKISSNTILQARAIF